jgi:thiosulfate/3-mercaptopyruvate sulfurtransferase
VFYDVESIVDSDSPLPHMLPRPEKFSSMVRKLGLGDGNRIIIYDNNAGMASCRAWWSFRVFGHADVAVLDGGLSKWIAEGRALADLSNPPGPRHFTGQFHNTRVRSRDQVLKNLNTNRAQVIDARPPGRFNGTDAEPRAGLRSGRIPGSMNIPFQKIFQAEHYATMRPAQELRQIFETAGLDLAKPVISSCGSGITACCLAFALHLIGHDEVSVYDGSWSEWGGDETCPIETDN